MAAITDPAGHSGGITYPAGSVIDGIGYRVTVRVSMDARELFPIPLLYYLWLYLHVLAKSECAWTSRTVSVYS